jgi:CheY-like chemotaxis protein
MTKKRVLIVDDMPLMRKLVRRFIEKLQVELSKGSSGCEFELLEAENGKAALDVLSKHRGAVDLILLDVMMPESDGFSFLVTRSGDHELAQVPVILTTALGEEVTGEEAAKLGVDATIRKPFTAKGFEEVFCKVLKIA